jgi:hypothetical protein
MIRRSLLAAALLVAAAAPALRAQSHLGVPAKDLTMIQVNLVDDGSGTLTKLWAEKRFGAATTFTGEAYTIGAKEILVLTDAEFTVQCTAASTSAPLFSPLINDAAGAGFHFPTRFRPSLLSPGQEQIHVSFTSGVVMPPSFQLAFPTMQVGNYTVRRAVFHGYYTAK